MSAEYEGEFYLVAEKWDPMDGSVDFKHIKYQTWDDTDPEPPHGSICLDSEDHIWYSDQHWGGWGSPSYHQCYPGDGDWSNVVNRHGPLRVIYVRNND